MDLSQILQLSFLGNTVRAWAIGAGVFLVALVALYIFKGFIIYRLQKISKKTNTEVDDLVIEGIKAVRWPFYVLFSLYIGSHFLSLPSLAEKIIYYVILVTIVYYVVRILEKLIDWAINKAIRERKEESGEEVRSLEESGGVVRLMATLAKVALWAGAIALLLANMGYNITSLVAGLGIGGIAVALAIQNVLGDVFSSLSIYLDKPFEIGDFIVVGGNYGTVKHVGIKSTRIELLQGEELIVSNSQLTAAEIRNFGIMEYRRVAFTIGVVYNTPLEKLKKIPEMIREIMEAQDKVEVERVHFKSFGDFSLVFEAIYYVQTTDYIEYMDIQQQINLGIVERFQKEGVEMAYPTQTIHVNSKS